MKIRSIETIPVEIARDPKVRISGAHGVILSARFIVVVVRTDEGIEGLGEAPVELTWTGEDIWSCKNCIDSFLAPILVNQDPLNVQKAVHQMNSVIAANSYAKASIEMALWDICGKVASLPLADLWGGRVRERVALKFVVSGPPKRAAELAVKYIASGFRYIKIKTGLELKEDLDRVRAVREAVGDDVPIGIDSNMGWSYLEAVRALPALEEARVSFIEQPFHRYPKQALAEFRLRTRIPLVLHENLFTVNDALELLTSRSADIWAVTPPTHGGYLGTRDILALARAGRIPCLLGSTIELGIASAFMAHIGVSTDVIDGTVPSDIIGPFYYAQDVVNEELEFEDGGVTPPAGVGLGVTPNMDVINHYRVDRS